MKVRLSKKVLADMPEQVRELVTEWQARYRKAFISVETVTKFCPGEDARVTILNLGSGQTASAQAAGEFAGMTRLSPTADIPLPLGCVAVVTEFFCGTPYLTIYQGGQPAPLKLSGIMVECDPATRGGFGPNMDYKP